MIYLEHINLVVSNIDEMLTFYRAAFPHWKIRAEGNATWSGKPRHWMHFGDDHQYLVLNDHGEGENRALEGHSVGLAHFAFVVTNLDALILRLKLAGFLIAKPGSDSIVRNNVYFIDPAGFEVEFVEYLSDLPAERNS